MLGVAIDLLMIDLLRLAPDDDTGGDAAASTPLRGRRRNVGVIIGGAIVGGAIIGARVVVVFVAIIIVDRA